MLAAKIQKERSDANDSKILMEWAATMYEECSLAVNNWSQIMLKYQLSVCLQSMV